MPFCRAVYGNKYGKLFAFQVFDYFIRKERPVRIDRIAQLKILGQLRAALFHHSLYELYRLLDKIHPHQGFTAKKGDSQIGIFFLNTPAYSEPHGIFHDLIAHVNTATHVAFFVIAIATAKIAAFRNA